MKEVFVRRHDTLDREELDACNHADHPKQFKEILAERFNDPEFSCYSVPIPNLHDDFIDSVDLSFDHMPGRATPDFLEGKINNMKTRLTKVCPHRLW